MLLAEKLANWTHKLKYSDLTPEAIHETKRRFIDSLGTSLGAYKGTPATITRKTALNHSQGQGRPRRRRCWHKAPHDARHVAAFANGAHIRYLDFNDTYLSKEPAHPSDNIAATLAVAQDAGRSAERTSSSRPSSPTKSSAALCDAASLRAQGWDHVTYGAFSATLGASKLWGLKADQMVHAQGLAGVCNIATRQTRTGQISMWKACAFSNACRNAVFATRISRDRDSRDPHEIFEGPKGVFKMLTQTASINPKLGSEEVRLHDQQDVHQVLARRIPRPELDRRGPSAARAQFMADGYKPKPT